MRIDMAPFMSRNGLAAMQLARQILGLPVGEQLPRARDMAAELGYGNGTIQAGLQLLEQSGAIATTSRGRLGTFLDRADRAALWDLGGMGSLTLAMPLPYTRRYEGLASGVRCAFDDLGVPLSLSYMRGSAERIGTVVEGRVDVAVTSGLAFDLLSEDTPIVELADLGPDTYVSSHGLVLAPGRSFEDAGLRVAVDRTSADQVHLVEQLFAGREDVRYVDVSYNLLDEGLHQGLFDATVWNLDEIDLHLSVPVTVQPVSVPSAPTATTGLTEAPATGMTSTDRNTHAVFVVREGSTRVPPALFADVDLDVVRTVLDDVLHARRMPSY